ncbi:universal stress protein [Nocardia abscessus]|uniref:universal stress protein n=1 Tax=Nocardia abscessus TaxID=120957 RepID=UPI003CC7FCD4
MPGTRGSGWYCGANIMANVSGSRTAPCSLRPPPSSAVRYRPMSRAASRTAQLVVLGSRGRGGVAGAALGSVSQTVLQSSRIPVLIAACRR